MNWSVSHLCRKHGLLIDPVALVLIQYGATPYVLGYVVHLGAVVGVDDQTAMGDAVATLQWQVKVPVQTTQLGAGAGENVLMKVLLVATLQLATEITQSILFLRSVSRRWPVIPLQLPGIVQFTRCLAVVRLSKTLWRWGQTMNAKGCHILGKLAANMLSKRCGQCKVEEGWIKLGALGKGDFALNSSRINEGSESTLDLQLPLN